MTAKCSLYSTYLSLVSALETLIKCALFKATRRTGDEVEASFVENKYK